MPRAKASLLVMATTALAVAVLFLLPYTPAKMVHTAVAARGDLVRSLMLSGSVAYAHQQPCVSLMDGKVASVHVIAGQEIRKGDLLFSLDTSAQQAALAAVKQGAYQQQESLNEHEALTALAAQQTLEWEKAGQELVRIIEMAQIRSPVDGVVEAVYAQPGAYLEAGGLLGAVRGTQRCVVASVQAAELTGIAADTPAVVEYRGRTLGAAMMNHQELLQMEGGMQQQAIFLPLAQEQLEDCSIGDGVTIHLLRETVENQVLLPLAAVDALGRVWYVDNGRARAQQVDASRRSESQIAVPAEWEGRHIILGTEGLYEGCPVKEAKVD